MMVILKRKALMPLTCSEKSRLPRNLFAALEDVSNSAESWPRPTSHLRARAVKVQMSLQRSAGLQTRTYSHLLFAHLTPFRKFAEEHFVKISFRCFFASGQRPFQGWAGPKPPLLSLVLWRLGAHCFTRSLSGRDPLS